MTTPLAAFADAVVKAGLIKPGKRHILRRIGFLISAGQNPRKHAIGRYLESRKRGKGYGPKGKRRARTGTYTGVYATGINKSGEAMDAIDALYGEIEKAGRKRMVKPPQLKGRTPNSSRSGMIPYGSRHQRQRAKFFADRARRNGEELSPRAKRARDYLNTRLRGRSGPRGPRTGVYKSTELPMTDCVDELYTEIEKARGLIRGGSRRMERRIGRQLAKDPQGPKAAKRFSALSTLQNRRKGNALGLGYERGKGYKSLTRRGRYK